MKTCYKCKEFKDLSEFYKTQNMCKRCFKHSKQRLVKCITCGVERITSVGRTQQNNGRCRSCAQKIEKNKSPVKERQREMSRQQVIRQGGIPNAHHFTSEDCGPKHWKWKGGISPAPLRAKKEYIEWREAVYRRDNNTCQICKEKILESRRRHAHHKKPIKNHPELVYDLDNGQTLCASCHAKHEGALKKYNESRKNKKIN